MTKFRLIGKGLSGWHASGKDNHGNKVSSSTYDTREGQLNEYVSQAENGALVYDASMADSEEFTDFVCSGPMCDPYLENGKVHSFSKEDRKTALIMAPALSGGFQTYALLAQDEKFSGLDYVAIDIYEALLRKIPGIRLGKVNDGNVIWE